MLNFSHFLLRHKRALSFALPAVVCLDACHNAYVVYKLYDEREKVSHRPKLLNLLLLAPVAQLLVSRGERQEI